MVISMGLQLTCNRAMAACCYNGGTPIAGWFILEHHIKMDDLGVALF